MKGILGGEVKAGDVVVIRYEGPKGGRACREMLYPTSYLKSKGLGKACALVTDGRFSGGTSGLSIGHASPEAAQGGTIGLVRQGDLIEIDIPNRTINLAVSEEELAVRRAQAGQARLEAGSAAQAQRHDGAESLCRFRRQRRQGRRAHPAGMIFRRARDFSCARFILKGASLHQACSTRHCCARRNT